MRRVLHTARAIGDDRDAGIKGAQRPGLRAGMRAGGHSCGELKAARPGGRVANGDLELVHCPGTELLRNTA